MEGLLSLKKNVVLITADDLNWNSVGCYGCRTPEITPNIDRLAAQGLRFEHAHVTIAVCQPSRGALATGRYPHRSGVEGFNHIGLGVPTLPDILREHGYLCGILGKCGHSTPCTDFEWDMTQDMPDLGMGRDPGLYRTGARAFLDRAAAEGRPFYLMANSHDPHRPFHASDQERKTWPELELHPPSRVYTPGEAEIPGFLPDLPDVRLELSEYYSSVRRCDDTVGALMETLEDSGLSRDTAVFFLSDNGMAFPFAKTNCYLHSTKTPWIARIPGVTRPGTADARHFISGIDFMPTVLDWIGVEAPPGVDGTSFLPVLRGEAQDGRDHVFTQFHETAARKRYPMRCVQSARFGYILNLWADGDRVFLNESQSGRTFEAMQEAAVTDEIVAARVKLFQYRTLEELYNFESDPDARVNLASDPNYGDVLAGLRQRLLRWMAETGDPAMEVARQATRQARQDFMAQQDKRSLEIHSLA